MELLTFFLPIQDESSVIFFLSTFILMLFAGEPVVLAVALFAAVSNTLSVPQIIFTAYVAALSGELFWFGVGKSPSINTITQKPYLRMLRADLDLALKKIRLDHPFHLLISTRIFTGITIPIIIHLSQKGLSLKKFIIYSLVVNAVWAPITVGVGRGRKRIRSGSEHIRWSSICVNNPTSVDHRWICQLSIPLSEDTIIFFMFQQHARKKYQKDSKSNFKYSV